MLRSYSNIN